jgi:hypothetical protein
MKRNLTGILSLVVMSLMINASAYAQSFAKANVPFAFHVGSKQLPAGTYVVNVVGLNAIEVRNAQTSAGALSVASGREYRSESYPKLVFHLLGNQYFLAEIWRGPAASGMTISPSKEEKSLEKELRLANSQPNVGEEVMIALK